jgi:hypothetical protein
VAWSAKDVAEMAARCEANGRRQDAAFYADLAAAARAEAGATKDAGEGRRSKYGNVRTEVDGIRFDSQAEARHYGDLRLRERAGEIADLRPAPAQPTKERFALGAGITYTPDFTYVEGGKRVAVDVKGVETESFRLRAKLFRARYPDIDLRVVKR